jgi:hypothetical protein
MNLRHTTGWRDLFGILIDIKYYGYHAAAAMHSKPTIYCKSCNSLNKNNFVKMQESMGDGQGVKCPNCHGTERLGRRFTPKHLKKIEFKISKKLEDVISYSKDFELVKGMYQYDVLEHKEDIMSRFEEYEKLAKRDLLAKRDCLFIVHYDTSKKWKKRSCYIPPEKVANIKFNDDRYFLYYEPLIKDFANINNKYSETRRHELLNKTSNILQEIGWPQSYIKDKINADMEEAVKSSIVSYLAERGLKID